MREFAEAINRVVWGFPALVLILGTGIAYSVKTRFLQVRYLPGTLRFVGQKLKQPSTGGVSPFQAVCTALAATVGTGNIAGVAGAIALGGPGAMFWMWCAGILGMIVKYGEVYLAVRYRRGEKGAYRGGPMYYMEAAFGNQKLASLYCVLGLLAASGVGNATQISTTVTALHSCLEAFGKSGSRELDIFLGLSLGLLLAWVLLGGAKRIGSAAELLIPAVSLGYIFLSLGAVFYHRDALPYAFKSIFLGAFQPRAFTGGAIGSMFLCLRVGVARGVFTNEAGLGTASIAHAGASTTSPHEQGLFGIFEVFVDTLLICSMTGFVILTSGAAIPYGFSSGAELTLEAFTKTYGPWVRFFLAISLGLFAYATVLGWGLYGMGFARYLFGERAVKVFLFLHCALAVLGSVLSPGLLWTLAETTNGLMAIPNLLAMWVLLPQISPKEPISS